METKEKKIGDKVKVRVRRYNQFITIQGVVKEIKRVFGRYEYLITEARTDDFWVRTLE